MRREWTGSAICAAGIHRRAPISACPACSCTYARCTVLIPLATFPAQPRYCRCTPAVELPAFSWPVSSSVPITSPRRRDRRAASSRPATGNRLTTPIAAKVFHEARLSSRCVRPGERSPAYSASVQPLRRPSPLPTALMYFPAASGVAVVTQHHCEAAVPCRIRRQPQLSRITQVSPELRLPCRS